MVRTPDAYDVGPGSNATELHRTELLLLVSGLVVLGVTALSVRDGYVSGAERSVFRWINGLARRHLHTGGGDHAAREPGRGPGPHRRGARASGGTGWRSGSAWRDRPPTSSPRSSRRRSTGAAQAALLDDVEQRGAHASGLGYVSGHSAVAFAVVTVAALWLAPKARTVLWLLAATVAFSTDLRRGPPAHGRRRGRRPRCRVRRRRPPPRRGSASRAPAGVRTLTVSRRPSRPRGRPRRRRRRRTRRAGARPGCRRPGPPRSRTRLPSTSLSLTVPSPVCASAASVARWRSVPVIGASSSSATAVAVATPAVAPSPIAPTANAADDERGPALHGFLLERRVDPARPERGTLVLSLR